ncbi:Mce family protein [Gordonia araii NBRC 100433]|uniref:Mce family protein n=1 Tax=Gordonia araii NBRC 100433 TaxID=1073574 RepID=G7GY07_9ACTN|nr:MCE family protein [Gordonia araii]NNG98093.1 MCE family protein [Gordonia araii NBRC 100433]GAB08482.1 Mce family protein [Gordonia araii NBRC 100433]
MTPARRSFIYIMLVVVAVAAAMAVIGRTIIAPVPGDKLTYTAEFEDVSGLYEGDAVRVAGVAVGKVVDVDLHGAAARVLFTVTHDHQLEDNSQVAVRYQNLVGQRYLEIIRHEGAAARQAPATVIPAARTIPSFDVTSLFNGVAPLIGGIDPAETNKLTESMVAVLQGDPRGVEPALEAVKRIAGLTQRRDVLLITMVDNLNNLAAQIGGRSGQVAKVVDGLNAAILRFNDRMSTVKQSLDYGDRVLVPFVDLLEMMQGSYDANYGPLDAFLNRIVPFTPQIVDVLAAIPGVLSAINEGSRRFVSATYSCSNGRLDLPLVTKALIGGREVVVCR